MVAEIVHHEALTQLQFPLCFCETQWKHISSSLPGQSPVTDSDKHDCQTLLEQKHISHTLRRHLTQMFCPKWRWLSPALSPALFLLGKICIHLGRPMFVLSKLYLSFKARCLGREQMLLSKACKISRYGETAGVYETSRIENTEHNQNQT